MTKVERRVWLYIIPVFLWILIGSFLSLQTYKTCKDAGFDTGSADIFYAQFCENLPVRDREHF